MRAIGANGVGRVSIQFEIANYGDLLKVKDGTLAPDQVRRMTLEGVVDTGAVKLVLPESAVKQLGLPIERTINVRYADGRWRKRQQAGGANLEILGRTGTYMAIVEPKRTTALIGAIVLEDLDLLVDCPNECLIPRDPAGPISEIE